MDMQTVNSIEGKLQPLNKVLQKYTLCLIEYNRDFFNIVFKVTCKIEKNTIATMKIYRQAFFPY